MNGSTSLILLAWTALAGPDDGYWTPRTDEALDAELNQACQASVADHKPVLLQFSAPWCIDCKKVRELGADPKLRTALDGWHELVVDVGRFDRHPELIKAFGVNAIAHWVALAPTDCGKPAPEWPRLKSATLEPVSGKSGPRTVDDLLAWLSDAASAKK